MAVDLTVLVARRPVVKIRDVELFKGFTGVLAHFRCNRPALFGRAHAKKQRSKEAKKTADNLGCSGALLSTFVGGGLGWRR